MFNLVQFVGRGSPEAPVRTVVFEEELQRLYKALGFGLGMTSPTVLAQKRSLLSRVRIDPFFSSQLLSMGDLPEQICQHVGMLKESVLDWYIRLS